MRLIRLRLAVSWVWDVYLLRYMARGMGHSLYQACIVTIFFRSSQGYTLTNRRTASANGSMIRAFREQKGILIHHDKATQHRLEVASPARSFPRRSQWPSRNEDKCSGSICCSSPATIQWPNPKAFTFLFTKIRSDNNRNITHAKCHVIKRNIRAESPSSRGTMRRVSAVMFTDSHHCYPSIPEAADRLEALDGHRLG